MHRLISFGVLIGVVCLTIACTAQEDRQTLQDIKSGIAELNKNILAVLDVSPLKKPAENTSPATTTNASQPNCCCSCPPQVQKKPTVRRPPPPRRKAVPPRPAARPVPVPVPSPVVTPLPAPVQPPAQIINNNYIYNYPPSVPPAAREEVTTPHELEPEQRPARQETRFEPQLKNRRHWWQLPSWCRTCQ